MFWLALPSFGESWHHNHHAFPRSAAHGLRWWEIDLSACVIGLMRRLGLAWDVVVIPESRQRPKLVVRERSPLRGRSGRDAPVPSPADTRWALRRFPPA